MITEGVRTALEALGCTVELCGSRVTCSTVPETSDWDYLVQIPNDERIYEQTLDALPPEWVMEGGEHYDTGIRNTFHSFRLGNVNLLVSMNAAWCERHRVATHICQQLDILHKPNRIMVFQAVLYGNTQICGEVPNP